MKAVQLENVGKKFILKYHSENPITSLLSSFSDKKITGEFWALRNINMEVEKGKSIGIVGRNGAGKTTLLYILSGACVPTVGRAIVNGNVSSMLALGAGFKSELSGNENIYLNGLLLGMSKKEISKKLKSIVGFSELDGFLNVPLQTYSSGMLLRLGFSVMIHIEFDILLVDEVITVGDSSFQKKCFEAMVNFRKEGKTIIFSTHSMDFIERFSDEVYVLEKGGISFFGKPNEAICYYQRLLNEVQIKRNI